MKSVLRNARYSEHDTSKCVYSTAFVLFELGYQLLGHKAGGDVEVYSLTGLYS